jgi:hypothetical protein
MSKTNSSNDSAGVSGLPVSRFSKIDIQPSVDDWQDYATRPRDDIQNEVTTGNAFARHLQEAAAAPTVFWGLFRQGGSCGETTAAALQTGTEQEMKLMSKRFNAQRTPGERRYYRIKYSARKLTKQQLKDNGLL